MEVSKRQSVESVELKNNIVTSAELSLLNEVVKCEPTIDVSKTFIVFHREIQFSSSVFFTICKFNPHNYSSILFKQLGIALPEQIKSSVQKRQAEYLAGRYSARKCIFRLTNNQDATTDIGIGENRSPLWPPGIVGSISHADQIACAIATDNPRVNYIGLDYENLISSDKYLEICDLIIDKAEKRLLNSTCREDNELFTLVFSAKETLFKCAYPSVKEYFDFDMAKTTKISFSKREISFKLDNDFATKYGLPCYWEINFAFIGDSVLTWHVS